jgi:hypothetical protein
MLNMISNLLRSLVVSLVFFICGFCLGIPEFPYQEPGNEWVVIDKYKQALGKRDRLLTDLFGKKPSNSFYSMKAKITWYSLSKDETDDTPDQAAHGKSRPLMAAISMHVVDALNLTPGDRIAVISDDGHIGTIVTYWDQKNPRYDDGSWIDIVAPSKKVALRWSIRPGRIVKI